MTTLKKIDGVYHARAGKKFISTGCANKAEAEAVLAQSGVQQLTIAAKSSRLTQRAIGQILTGRNLTCAKALAEYQRLKAASKSVKTVANNVLVIGNWMHDAKVETLPPSAVTVNHIARWINNPDSKWKRSTRQVALASVRTFFEFCADQGWIVSDPSQLVALDYSVMSHEQKEHTDKQPFTEDEVKHIVKELRHDWHLAQKGRPELFQHGSTVLFWLVAVSIARETGLRLSDIAQLEWRSFSEAGKLCVWTEKTNKRLEHPISEALQNLIGEIPVNDPEFVFHEQRALIRDVSKRAGLSVQFARLLARLQISNRSFHSLRHYKATSTYSKLDKDALARKLAASLSMAEIAALLGHSDKKTTKNYVHE